LKIIKYIGGPMNKKFKSLALTLALGLTLGACSGQTATVDKTSTEGSVETSTGISGEFEGKAKGYAGDILAKVTLEDGEITKIETGEEETETIGHVAIGKLTDEIVAKNSLDVESVSGATVSSTAFLKAIKATLDSAGLKPEDLKASESSTEALDLDQETQVVVVGAGGAGLTSAIKLAQEGIDVLVLEKAEIPGGNTSRASAGMNAAETHYQKEQGVEDTVEQFVEDTMKGGKKLNNKDLVEKMAKDSSKAIDWLDSIDAPLKELKFSGGATNMRTHAALTDDGKSRPVGSYLIEKLTAKADELGIKTIYGAKVDKIIMEDGKAAGVEAETKDGKLTVNADAVIVATGGFGGSMDRVKEYRPDLDGYVSTNVSSVTGDAIDFLSEAGANFIDMDQIQIHPTVMQSDGSLISEGLRGEGAILVNQDGKRFINELETRDKVSAAELDQEKPGSWLIVDQKMMDDSTTIKSYLDKGFLQKADDVKALAEIIGADEEVLKETLENWTSYVKNNKDDEFDRQGLDTVKSDLSSAPYYVVNVAPGIHHTMGGVEVNTNSEVLDKEHSPIAGLYAAGEVTGGIHGGNRLGGNAVTDIVVFGLNAAENAKAFIEQ
jgi:fumarate reductase flavoprotein subunit